MFHLNYSQINLPGNTKELLELSVELTPEEVELPGYPLELLGLVLSKK